MAPALMSQKPIPKIFFDKKGCSCLNQALMILKDIGD